jgi:hypothetical protein
LLTFSKVIIILASGAALRAFDGWLPHALR